MEQQGIDIGLGSYAFRYAVDSGTRPMSAESFLDRAAAMGAEAVQICDNLPVLEWPAEKLEALRRRAEERDLRVELGMKAATGQEIESALEAAETLGAPILRVVLDDPVWRQDLGRTRDILGKLSGQAGGRGVRLALENHFLLGAEELASLITGLSSPSLGACIDPFNSVSQLVGPEQVIRVLAPLSICAHIKDVIVRREGTGFCVRGCPLGGGILDLGAFLSALSGHAESVHIEGWMDPAEDEARTLSLENEWARQGIETLKRARGSVAERTK